MSASWLLKPSHATNAAPENTHISTHTDTRTRFVNTRFRDHGHTCTQVSVEWGDARERLAKVLAPGRDAIDLLFLDGTPKEYLEYLEAAEPFLAPGG